MRRYLLFYWDVPFRGIFPQLLLEEVKAEYEWRDASEIYPEKSLKIHHPGMAPPYLYDTKTHKYLSQMPAIMMHLAREHDYLPMSTEGQDLALKIILDCNDLLLEITNCHGKLMWAKKEWDEFRNERLPRWLTIFEQTGKECGLNEDNGYLLGPSISVADVALTALLGTLLHSFHPLKEDVHKHAPRILHLCESIELRSGLRSFLEDLREQNGQTYCGGEIENSIREMIGD